MRNYETPSTRPRTVIIYCFPFDESNGGSLALLELARRLHAASIPVAVWPSVAPGPPPSSLREAVTFARMLVREKFGPAFDLGPFRVPVARRRDLREGIVVYPEVVAGNPLKASRVVRWFLHRPGFHTGRVAYGSGETYFYYQDAFNDASINPDADHRLQVTYVNDHYRRVNEEPRTGTCCMVRKSWALAKGRTSPDEPLVDGLSHEATAAAFNTFEYFRCFDPYTMYTVYAAVCGCIPVVEPAPGLTKEEWYPRMEDRYGVAYGWADAEISWAVETRHLLLARLSDAERSEDEMVRRFVSVLRKRFP